MGKWSDLPPDIGTILRRTKELKLTKAINMFIREDGLVMVSVQDPKNSTNYKIAHSEDPLAALIEALGPGYGQSWKDHLKPEADDGPEDDDMDVI